MPVGHVMRRDVQMAADGEVRFTILNSMAGRELPEALDRHVQWGVELLDLKDGLFGRGVLDLTDEQAGRAAELAGERGLKVYCLSTGLFHDDAERGEAHFEARHLARVDRAIEIARMLRPRFIRLLAAWSRRRGDYDGCAEYVEAECPWLVGLYGQAVDRIHAAGFAATVENEVGQCIFRRPADIVWFFGRLGRREKVCLTWDVQNLWQMGTFPTFEAYEELRPLIGYLHLKGGQCDPPDGRGALVWRSSLAEASWPVAEIARRAAADGVSPVICLNPSHGCPREGAAGGDFTERDLDFIRRAVAEGSE